MTHRRYERVLVRTCELFRLKPSGWLPRWTQPRGQDEAGIFTVAYPITESGELDTTRPHYYPAMDFYDVMQSWTFARRTARGLDPFRGWGRFWGFLFEVSLGAYDWMDWSKSKETS